ncbi:MAG: sugar phosphate isomerase/epimerase [Lachnospiraceae bacterium]|nr:sugar phosphate isomerase/epimerase [Lachnospiraceae bacterium]MBP3611385.1 sugar phosphate isomerase/epimerase [Lachnospiraceae bacterium]
MLRLGVRGHDMPAAPFDELVKSISDAGFCCTQLALAKAVRDFNVGTEAMTSGMADYMKRVFEKNQVEVAVLGCYRNLADPDTEKLKKTMDVYMHHIRFASFLECGMVGTETGAVNTEYKYTPENHTDKALHIFIENLKRIVEYAEKMGVCIGIEPVYKHIMCDVERTRKVLDAVASPNLRVILDPINLLNAENEKQHEKIVEGAFELLGQEIDAIHIKDYVMKDGEIVYEPLTVGEGCFNIPHLLGILKKKKPFIHVLLEASTPQNVQASCEYIRRCYEEA